ncbi:UDP-N-acetylglucosamine 4,6-dehydratase [Pseudoalteromonas shioyasakiensis]|nr:UDP-N-acetylglucosamine 4,6-dehydratase [Pseudoalteromonas shioyasakiensis]
MMKLLHLLNRNENLFDDDLASFDDYLSDLVSQSRFLVLGGAGTIGQSVTKELFKRRPQVLHVVDISENNLVELVRDIRSSYGYIGGEFKTFSLDIGSLEFESFMAYQSGYDYVLNLSALKHVRSEKDPFTLMRMVETNIFNTQKSLFQAINKSAKKYFSVSTDKAANPVNMMGASKRIMELFLMQESRRLPVSMARFANVAFSDGSLMHSFDMRIMKEQPLVAPTDVLRYFVTPEESGQLCLLSCLLGNNLEIFFPKLNDALHLQSFSNLASRYLKLRGFEPYLCESEEQARQLSKTLPKKGKWPCLFSSSDTSGEKPQEEFYTEQEIIDWHRFSNVGVIKQSPVYDEEQLRIFSEGISDLRHSGKWTSQDIVYLFESLLPEFQHLNLGKSLEEKM